MFTKTDLKQLRSVISEKIEAEAKIIKDDLETEIKLGNMHVLNELNELKSRTMNVEIVLNRLQKDLKLVAKLLGKENLKTIKRVE